jgi:hypothetical protein
VSVVVPVYNEADHLWPMAQALRKALDRVAGPSGWQYVLVDNGSADAPTAAPGPSLNREYRRSDPLFATEAVCER